MIFLLASFLPPLLTAHAGTTAGTGWLSPTAIVGSPDGRSLYVACADGARVLQVNLAARKVVATLPTASRPTGLALSSDGQTLFVTCAAPRSTICILDLATAKATAALAAGHTAMAPVLSSDGRTLYVCNRFNDDVSVLDVVAHKELRRIRVRREPVAAALTPDGRHLLVANLLPAGRADLEHVACVLTVIDTDRGEVVDELRLPNGTTAAHDVRISPDGRTAIVTHVLGRFWVPTRTVESGAMNANAVTVVDLAEMRVANTVLLDDVGRGAANPWGAAWSADSRTVVVTHAATHELSVIDHAGLREKLARSSPAPRDIGPYASSVTGPRGIAHVRYDLSFLHGIRERRPLPTSDVGPRAVAIVGRLACVVNYFSDTLTVLELDGAQAQAQSIPLGPPPRLTPARRGEIHFHDAQLCRQGWQTCASCHPGGARVDALNWDLLNDGSGNPKNSKSLLLAFETPPAMSTGVRATARAAVRAGIHHILFTDPPAKFAEELDAYIASLAPLPSPHREPDGRLSPAAARGERLFHDNRTRCATCHRGAHFTDLKRYDVGTWNRRDRRGERFDTPTLIELWRTAPYLHDGSAPTLRDVLTAGNAADRHGRTAHLSADEIGDLCAYLLSL